MYMISWTVYESCEHYYSGTRTKLQLERKPEEDGSEDRLYGFKATSFPRLHNPHLSANVYY
jgi:hypothetical protein